MSTWTTPITWSNGAVTAATMNTEVRDHLNFLKGFADLISSNTTADTGNATLLEIVRGATSGVAFQAKVSGDAGQRFNILANGEHGWGSGGGTPVTMLQFNTTDSALQTANRVLAITTTSMLKVSSKSGAVTDADIPGTYTGGATGLCMADSSSNRLYMKFGSTWRWVAFT